MGLDWSHFHLKWYFRRLIFRRLITYLRHRLGLCIVVTMHNIIKFSIKPTFLPFEILFFIFLISLLNLEIMPPLMRAFVFMQMLQCRFEGQEMTFKGVDSFSDRLVLVIQLRTTGLVNCTFAHRIFSQASSMSS